jgi:DNA-binding winged helix-turn-helix (wHTH) protein
MSFVNKHLYQFKDFRLDTKEKILMRDNEPVSLTPKMFEMLSVLVENHGKLIQKEELMKKIWADSFVEESNLTFNIRQLRKVLGDDAQNPTYIKTVPRHGYRFIAPVVEITEEQSAETTENLPAELVTDCGTIISTDSRADTGRIQTKSLFYVLQKIRCAACFKIFAFGSAGCRAVDCIYHFDCGGFVGLA